MTYDSAEKLEVEQIPPDFSDFPALPERDLVRRGEPVGDAAEDRDATRGEILRFDAMAIRKAARRELGNDVLDCLDESGALL